MSQKNLHVMMTADARSVEEATQAAEKSLQRLEQQTASINRSMGGFESRMGMVASGVGGLTARLGEVAGGANPFDVMKQSAEGLIGMIPGIGPELAAGVRVVESAFNKIRETQKQMAEEGKHAHSLGLSVEDYSRLKFAIGDAELLDKALFKIAESSAKAAAEGGSIEEAFKRAGFTSEQIARGNITIQQLADGLKGIDNVGERARVASEILGDKLAKNLLPDFNKGSEYFDRMGKMSDEKGLTTTEEMVAMVKEANLAWKQLDLANEGFWKDLSAHTGPLVKELAGDLEAITSIKVGGKDGYSLGDSIASGLSAMYKMAKHDPMAISNAALEMNAAQMSAEEKAQEERGRKLDAQLKELHEREAKRIEKEADDFEKAHDRMMEHLRTEADKVTDSLMTPFEKAMAEAKKLDEYLVTVWAGDLDKYNAAMGKIAAKMAELDAKHSNSPAVGLGSVADYTARVKWQNEGNAADNVTNPDYLRQLRDNSDLQLKELRKLGEKFATTKVAVMQ
jgi:hypothetical protein